jgi:hypothetical protein
MTLIGLTRKRLGGEEAGSHAEEGALGKPRSRGLWWMLLIVIQAIAAESAMAQTRGGALTLRYAVFSPVVALLAGILILIMPRLLNYIVAVYLILIGLIGLLG